MERKFFLNITNLAPLVHDILKKSRSSRGIMQIKNMIKLLAETANTIEIAFQQIESVIPPPSFVKRGEYHAFRYEKETIEAAIVQKCAKLTSSLNASLVLLQSGYVQELGALFRMLDEYNEDILFLCQAIQEGGITDLHEKYLTSFYQEEFDNPDNTFLSTQNRPTIPRKKIRAALSRIPEQELNPSDFQELHRTMSQAYSGYVHAASTHVMEMYGGDPPKFHVRGLLGTPSIAEFAENIWDYFYRGLITITMVSRTFNQENLVVELNKFRTYVEEQSGQTDWEHPEVLVKKMKKNA